MKLSHRISHWKNVLFRKMGYISESICEAKMEYQRKDFNLEYSKLENLQLDRLIDSIRTVNMIKFRFETPTTVQWFEDSDPSLPVQVEYKEDYPPKSDWYQYRVSINVSKLRRIHEELIMSQNSYELEYLKKSFWHHIEQNLDALIKMELGAR